MKKIVSLVLVACMLLGMTSVLASCKKVRAGEEAAKLLLANERLDESILDRDIDLGFKRILASVPSDRETLSYASRYFAEVDSIAGSSASRTFGPSDFDAYSLSAYDFNSFMVNIEGWAGFVAEDIANMKNRVGVVDKWVSVSSGEEHMLRVYENRDALIVKDSSGDIAVYYRYTDAQANNVYEMYNFNNYDDGTTGSIRTLFIPGQRYEYMYRNSNGFDDYFIADNSRGYWVATRFAVLDRDDGPREMRFTPYVIRDGLAYSAYVSAIEDVNNGAIEYGSYTVFDVENNRELVSMSLNEDVSTLSLHFSGIKSGFVSVSSLNGNEYEGVYDTHMISSFTTTNGTINASEEKSESFTLTNYGRISYETMYDTYFGEVKFMRIAENTNAELECNAFKSYLDSIGITLHCNMSDVVRAIEHAELFAANFGDSFSWNGYQMNTIDNSVRAVEALDRQFADARADFDAVKDYPKTTSRQKLARNAHFGAIKEISMGSNSYNNGVISVSGIAASISDTALFESGKSYVLKVGLALCDANGNPASVNTVALAGPQSAVQFSGGSITLTASGGYTVPKNLSRGDYAVVVYAADANEGIRVSEMVKVGSFSTYDGKLDSEAMDIKVKTENGNLRVTYTIKNSITATVTATKDSYTYAQIKRMLDVEILKKGAPYSHAVIEYANGEEVPEGQSLGKGTYRMLCYLPTADGLAESYAYVVLN